MKRNRRRRKIQPLKLTNPPLFIQKSKENLKDAGLPSCSVGCNMGRRIYLCRKRTAQRGGCRIWLQKRGGAERGVQAAVGSRSAGEGRRSRLQ
ncbi:hypothetical protein SLEP1_g37868 [Rubroshorea leprosula]|uniref:Uncharacterized protein n=1 Tax=Rubroshorea leprosula TaxID=152421 RepID=A0AAV5KW20_9ROSI|nr:hypothetical protein SLEP1_g37868 [Rubroshorea leprosula]